MTTARSQHTATLLLDGTVLIAGGCTNSRTDCGILSSAELYHPRVPTPAPVLFSLSGDGEGQGAIWHAESGLLASPANPAYAGDVLALYTTNLFDNGATPPQLAVGGLLAKILFFGKAPGYPGFNQVNFALPDKAMPGAAVSVRLTYLGRPSNQVTIGVQ